MTPWLDLVCRASLNRLQSILRDAVSKITALDVAGARSQVKAEIQRRHGLPGTLRRWLCQEIDSVRAANVDELRANLSEAIARLTL